MEKLEIAQRELKHMHTSLKATWAMLDVEQRKFKEAQQLLNRWLIYGENTHCESQILLDETKKLIKG
jgi:hypothetical protein